MTKVEFTIAIRWVNLLQTRFFIFFCHYLSVVIVILKVVLLYCLNACLKCLLFT